MDSFHAEVSKLVCASERRLESGKDDDDQTVSTYAFRSGCSIYRHRDLMASLRVSPEKVSLTRNLVDPASSHMLVSRTKPCKSQSKWITVGLQTAH